MLPVLVALRHTQAKLNELYIYITFIWSHKNVVMYTQLSFYLSTNYTFSKFTFEKNLDQIFLVNLQRFIKFMEASEEFLMTRFNALESYAKKCLAKSC